MPEEEKIRLPFTGMALQALAHYEKRKGLLPAEQDILLSLSFLSTGRFENILVS